ncbi:hypothetical protein Dimus_025984 [Dionaea muscipula]
MVEHMRIRSPFSPRQQGSYPKLSMSLHVPRGHFAIYVGNDEEKERFVIPISYLKHPLFQELLRKAEEEFGYDYGMGGLTVPCTKCYFMDLVSRLNDSNGRM